MLALLILSMMMLFLVFQPLSRWPPAGLWLKRRAVWVLAVSVNRYFTGAAMAALAALRSRVRELALQYLRYRRGAGVLAMCRANQL